MDIDYSPEVYFRRLGPIQKFKFQLQSHQTYLRPAALSLGQSQEVVIFGKQELATFGLHFFSLVILYFPVIAGRILIFLELKSYLSPLYFCP